jgi:hypothetical protein
MAKPILIVRIPEKIRLDVEKLQSIYGIIKNNCQDYNVLVFNDDGIEAEIITEHNQPQGLSV